MTAGSTWASKASAVTGIDYSYQFINFPMIGTHQNIDINV